MYKYMNIYMYINIYIYIYIIYIYIHIYIYTYIYIYIYEKIIYERYWIIDIKDNLEIKIQFHTQYFLTYIILTLSPEPIFLNITVLFKLW